MSSQPVLSLIPKNQKSLLRNLMQAYRHDLSQFDGEDPDEMGPFGVGNYFDVYWEEPCRHPFKITVRGTVAGFALVRELGAGSYSISEFFILRRHRRSGIGQAAARQLFDRFGGIWHVAQDDRATRVGRPTPGPARPVLAKQSPSADPPEERTCMPLNVRISYQDEGMCLVCCPAIKWSLFGRHILCLARREDAVGWVPSPGAPSRAPHNDEQRGRPVEVQERNRPANKAR
jgi:predicted acetyltransferase